MNPWIYRSAILLAAGILGSIPFGLLITKAFGKRDIRDEGSGNIGATNVSRVLGFWPWGLATFVLDLGKGALGAWLGSEWVASFQNQVFTSVNGIETLPSISWIAAVMAVAGHCFSPWIGFSGGKGVATGLGAFLVLSPIPAAVGLIVFAFVFATQKIVSLSSIAGLVATAVAQVSLFSVEPKHFATFVIVFLILVRHESNLDALLEGRERVFRA